MSGVSMCRVVLVGGREGALWLPAGGIRASQGAFSSCKKKKKYNHFIAMGKIQPLVGEHRHLMGKLTEITVILFRKCAAINGEIQPFNLETNNHLIGETTVILLRKTYNNLKGNYNFLKGITLSHLIWKNYQPFDRVTLATIQLEKAYSHLLEKTCRK